VNHDTGAEGHLYAIRFTSGTVKVGRTEDAPRRIAEHLAAAAIHDVTASCVWISKPVPQLEQREEELLAFCRGRWEVAAGGEYFRRADLAAIVKQANTLGIPTQEVRGELVATAAAFADGPRTARLRKALEAALQGHVYAFTKADRTRIYAPAPTPDNPRWRQVLDALQEADRWGSSNTTGTPEIFAEVVEVST